MLHEASPSFRKSHKRHLGHVGYNISVITGGIYKKENEESEKQRAFDGFKYLNYQNSY